MREARCRPLLQPKDAVESSRSCCRFSRPVRGTGHCGHVPQKQNSTRRLALPATTPATTPATAPATPATSPVVQQTQEHPNDPRTRRHVRPQYHPRLPLHPSRSLVPEGSPPTHGRKRSSDSRTANQSDYPTGRLRRGVSTSYPQKETQAGIRLKCIVFLPADRNYATVRNFELSCRVYLLRRSHFCTGGGLGNH